MLVLNVDFVGWPLWCLIVKLQHHACTTKRHYVNTMWLSLWFSQDRHQFTFEWNVSKPNVKDEINICSHCLQMRSVLEVVWYYCYYDQKQWSRIMFISFDEYKTNSLIMVSWKLTISHQVDNRRNPLVGLTGIKQSQIIVSNDKKTTQLVALFNWSQTILRVADPIITITQKCTELYECDDKSVCRRP